MLGTRSVNSVWKHLVLLAEKGRVKGAIGTGQGRGSGIPRATVVAKPLSNEERRAFGFPAFQTVGSYDTGQRCIVCGVSRVFDGIAECIECRNWCDISD